MRYVKLKRIRSGFCIVGALAVLQVPCAAGDQRLDAADRSYRAGQHEQAGRIYSELARAGDPEAQFRLGMLYYLGRGVSEDEKQAFAWIERSAKQGQLDAQYRLATLYTLRHGVPGSTQDADVEAARWYFRAAARGHAEAQYTLALMFITGKGVQQSTAEAEKWMRRAAEQGFEAAVKFSDGATARPPLKK